MKVVDEYRIGIEEKSGFSFVVLSVLCADGSTESYEFAPSYAHALSDELCVASAKAAKRDTSHGA